MDTLHERERMTWAQWGMMWTPCIKRQNIVSHLVGNDVDTFPMQRTLSASAKKHDSCPIHFATLGPRALDTFDLSVKSISKSFQNLISIFISYQYLKNCSLSHLPIFPHFGKSTQSLGNVRPRTDRPMWRWKDMRKNNEQDRVSNAFLVLLLIFFCPDFPFLWFFISEIRLSFLLVWLLNFFLVQTFIFLCLFLRLSLFLVAYFLPRLSDFFLAQSFLSFGVYISQTFPFLVVYFLPRLFDFFSCPEFPLFFGYLFLRVSPFSGCLFLALTF